MGVIPVVHRISKSPHPCGKEPFAALMFFKKIRIPEIRTIMQQVPKKDLNKPLLFSCPCPKHPGNWKNKQITQKTHAKLNGK
jgi:hypothetical protein